MVAVVLGFQSGEGIFPAQTQPSGQNVQVRAHLGKDLLLRDAAYGCVLLQHADVLYVVELAEDAEL